ncbi:MAG: CDP-diacylglycerol--glycerol-3-phosphate 3-phosphatidyltransferase [Gammaproteobacteria bacterium]|nr:CDP-diacylglycerol--glycerol-3-phosphate 3-phosphatidyltransferase [Gammaproteobacteria bacterium]
MPINTPNILTLIRILIIPVIIVVYFVPSRSANEIVTFLFVLAAITDWLDGYLARRWNRWLALRAFLDPVADKLIVATALILLASDRVVLELVYSKILFTIVTCVIIGREITISALREWMAGIGARSSVAVGMIGKIKTGVQMVAISMLLYHDPLWGLPVFKVGEIALYAAAALTLWSMFVYLRAAWPTLVDEGAA